MGRPEERFSGGGVIRYASGTRFNWSSIATSTGKPQTISPPSAIQVIVRRNVRVDPSDGRAVPRAVDPLGLTSRVT